DLAPEFVRKTALVECQLLHQRRRTMLLKKVPRRVYEQFLSFGQAKIHTLSSSLAARAAVPGRGRPRWCATPLTCPRRSCVPWWSGIGAGCSRAVVPSASLL